MILSSAITDKPQIFKEIEQYLQSLNFHIVQKDFNRPWGGFFVIDENEAPQFAATFFSHLKFTDIQRAKLSPKILVVEPQKRLSWQYHHRRSELWRVISGQVGVIISDTDHQGPLQQLNEGEAIQLSQGERHRLVGLETWGVLAEIWQHSDVNQPSDEDDIVRVEDDFGR